jgi:uncharacterized OB-fold protein
MSTVLLPVVDPDSAPFWAAAREHRLAIQRCDECGAFRFPVKPICPCCHSWSSTWTELTGKGRLRSWVTTHHVTHPAFVRQLPYVVLYVELDAQPGLLMYGNLRPPAAAVFSGMAVKAVFEDVSADITLVQWQPDEAT